jgi:hypothetical protein
VVLLLTWARTARHANAPRELSWTTAGQVTTIVATAATAATVATVVIVGIPAISAMSRRQLATAGSLAPSGAISIGDINSGGNVGHAISIGDVATQMPPGAQLDPGRVGEPKLTRVVTDRGDRRGAVPRGNMSRPTIRSIPNTGVAEAATVEEQVKRAGLANLATMVASALGAGYTRLR